MLSPLILYHKRFTATLVQKLLSRFQVHILTQKFFSFLMLSLRTAKSRTLNISHLALCKNFVKTKTGNSRICPASDQKSRSTLLRIVILMKLKVIVYCNHYSFRKEKKKSLPVYLILALLHEHNKYFLIFFI